MRDDFPTRVKETLAKRAGLRCSNPRCRRPTSGPTVEPENSINIGVAAHITAASPRGPRYDADLDPADRASLDNAIWLCQKCAKLVDSDTDRYTVQTLRGWKYTAELSALRDLEAAGSDDQPAAIKMFARIEQLMPKLLEEMRQDLAENPLIREFALLQKRWSYSTMGNEFVYYFEDHANLDGAIRILENHGLVTDITTRNVSRYVLSEELVEYLHDTNRRR